MAFKISMMAQPVTCGTVILPPLPPGTPPDSIVLDRFGNERHISSLRFTPKTNNGGQRHCHGDVFNLVYDANVPTDVRRTVDQVFCDLSHLLETGQNAICGTSWTRETANISVAWVNMGDHTGGTGTPMYIEAFDVSDPTCDAVIHNAAFVKISGGTGRLIGPGVVDGELTLNSNVVLPVSGPAPWHLDWTTDPDVGEVDLYSVVLHEAMHILAFSSRVGLDRTYSQYDRLLGMETDDVIEPLFTTTNLGGPCAADARNCWVFRPPYDLVSLQAAINNNCSGPEPRAVANGIPVSNGQGSIWGDLSHLSIDPSCNPLSVEYVMAPGFGTGPLADRRQLMPGELGILAALGYGLANNLAEPCYAIAQADESRTNATASCCYKVFTVCAGGHITISENELLCNDFRSTGSSLDVTRVWTYIQIGFDPVIFEAVDQGNSTWRLDIPSNIFPQQVTLYYTVRGCNCSLHTIWSSFSLRIRQCPPCVFPPGPCDNLVCNGDFEGFTNTVPAESELGWPIIFQGAETAGTPDIRVEGGNHFLHMGRYTNLEAVNLPLRECVPPGCTMDMQLLIGSASTASGALQIWGSPTRPCDASVMGVTPIARNCAVTTPCSPIDLFTPICVRNVPTSGTNGLLQPATMQPWLNNTNQEVCFLTLVPEVASILADNIVVTRRCAPTVTIEPSTDGEICPNSVFTLRFRVCAPSVPGQPNAEVHLNLNLPNGLTLDNGAPNVVLTILEGTCQTLEFRVRVDGNVALNTVLAINLTGFATGLCANEPLSSNIAVTVRECTDFFCPCLNVSSAFNVDAGDVFPGQQGVGGTSILQTTIPALTTSTTLDGYRTLSVPCLAIRGRLLIDEGYKLEVSYANIRMQPGAEILVRNGAALRLLNTTVEGCVQMWRGITVEGGGSFETNAVFIRDAQFGATARPTPTHQTLFKVNKTQFERNHVGILLEADGPMRSYSHSFSFNQFRAANLLPSYDQLVDFQREHGYAGMVVRCSAVPGIGRNIFEDLRNGLMAESSLLWDVHFSTFRNIVGTFDPSFTAFLPQERRGVGITTENSTLWANNCTFEQIHRAIHTEHSETHVRSCDFSAVHTGVVLSYPDSRPVEVSYCPRVHFTHYGVRCFANRPSSLNILWNSDMTMFPTTGTIDDKSAIDLRGNGGWWPATLAFNNITLNERGDGIQASGCGNLSIANNTIRVNRSLSNFTFAGIDLAFAHDCRVSDNTVWGAPLTAGMIVGSSQNSWYCDNHFFDMSYGTFFSFGCGDSKFRENILFSTQRGLELSQGTTIGIQRRAGNQWAESYSDFGAAHWGTDFEVADSRFYIQPTNPPMAPPFWPPSFSPDDWFFNCTPAQCSNLPVCPMNNEPPSGEDPPIDEGDYATMNNAYAVGVYGTALQFEEGRRVYAKLRRAPETMAGNETVQHYYQTASMGTLGAFHDATTALEGVWTPGIALAGEQAQLDVQIGAAARALARLDSLMALLPAAADSTALAQQKQGLFVGLEPLVLTWDAQQNALQADRAAKTPGALAAWAALPSASTPEANLKTIQRVHLETIGKGIRRLNNAQRAAVAWVAWQCPGEGGSAVYLARNLYRMLVDDAALFNNAQLCPLEASPRSEGEGQTLRAGDIALFPNPAADRLTLRRETPELLGKSLRVRLLDPTGRLAVEATWPVGDETLELDTAELPNGLYFCVVTEGGQNIAQQKIIVQH